MLYVKHLPRNRHLVRLLLDMNLVQFEEELALGVVLLNFEDPV